MEQTNENNRYGNALPDNIPPSKTLGLGHRKCKMGPEHLTVGEEKKCLKTKSKYKAGACPGEHGSQP